MRLSWTALLALCCLSGCGSKEEMNALALRPLEAYVTNQDEQEHILPGTEKRLLAYCRQQTTERLPSRRGEVTEVTFRHPLYAELGSQTIKYWVSGDDRYLSCANSHEQIERTFRVDPVDEFESLISSELVETDVGEAVSFYPEPDVAKIVNLFRINQVHETIVPGSTFRYQTPDSGSLYVTYEVMQNGRTLDRTIEPGLFVFKSGKNDGYAFLTKLADDRVALQMGTESSWERTVLPSAFTGKYVYTDSTTDVFTLDHSKRQLLKRVVLAEQPIGDVSDATSLTLSKQYDAVIEVWGSVRRPMTTKLMSSSARSVKTKLATYETKGKTSHLDGPNTQALFELLTHVAGGDKSEAAVQHGTLSLYEHLQEQHFEVWVEPGDQRVYLIDLTTKQTYAIDLMRLEELLNRSIRYNS
ncbi:hypothetical protein EVJ24_02040 [Exiguobacterium sp. SH1S21]|uniref:hypothetical protein n=1 Tax=Exiguobacterium sp. SH1S21 TaxID=2510953 RepID=UPI00103C1A46|nr:hypothetical protein [Exiguobacterium sp. SH1S21]TCI57575.1 hypothetical protein EVJ24_02040 [Exiguobacterium sp. SH1S21]